MSFLDQGPKCKSAADAEQRNEHSEQTNPWPTICNCCATGTERRRLDRIADFDFPLAAVAEELLNHLGAVTARNDYCPDTGGRQLPDQVLKEGMTVDRQHRLGDSIGKGTQASASPTCENDRGTVTRVS